MACEYLRDKEGHVTAIVYCRSRVQCKFCHNQPVAKLCDFPTGPKGKTCDAGMCAKCATSVGPDQDYCPTHKHQAPPTQQRLFEERP